MTPIDPTRIRTTSDRVRPAEAWWHTLAFASRAMKTMFRNPDQFFDVTLQPVMFTLMFAYLFGGAISGEVANYLPMMIPGILAMICLTASMATGVQLREDMDTGVFDRFRSLPVARLAPLAGPLVADLLRYAIAGALTLATGIAMGYRPGGGALGVLAGVALVTITGWSLSWTFAFVGTIAGSAQSVQGISMIVMFPLTFLSNAFVPVETVPGWLQTFARINPISHVVTALRDLINDAALTPAVVWALLGCAVVIAVFAPLAVRSYQRER